MTELGRTVRRWAPAKVNPWLAVLGQREDGFHALDTGMLALELADWVEVRAGEVEPGSVTTEVHGPHATKDVPRDGTNLATRAAQIALERGVELDVPAARNLGLALCVEKNVPSQAGLGGGSSDAAAALLAVEAFLQADLGAAWRRSALAQLGSDCVFFAEARETGVAACKGRGELVEPLPPVSRSWWVALVVPTARCSTREVYGAMGKALSAPSRLPKFPSEVLGVGAEAARALLFNHLEDAAFRVVPEMSAWRATLDQAGAEHFRLSGSGSAFFGLYPSADDARAGLDRVIEGAQRRGLEARGTWVTRPAPRHP